MSLDQQTLPNVPVYLNPAYTDFIPGVTELKFSTLNRLHPIMLGVAMIGLVLLSTALVFVCGMFVTTFQQDRLLEREGVKHSGEIVRCRELTSSRSRSIDVTYSYEVDDETYQHTTNMPDDRCTLFQEGASIDVLYVASNPESARLVDETSDTPFIAFAAFAIFGLLIAVGFGVFGYFRSRSQFGALKANGQVLDGNLISAEHKIKRGKNSRKPYLDIRFRFTSPNGMPLEGKMQTFDRTQIARQPLLKPGVPVKVLYADDKVYVML